MVPLSPFQGRTYHVGHAHYGCAQLWYFSHILDQAFHFNPTVKPNLYPWSSCYQDINNTRLMVFNVQGWSIRFKRWGPKTPPHSFPFTFKISFFLKNSSLWENVFLRTNVCSFVGLNFYFDSFPARGMNSTACTYPRGATRQFQCSHAIGRVEISCQLLTQTDTKQVFFLRITFPV